MEQMEVQEQGIQPAKPSLQERLTHQWQQRTLLWEFLKRDLQARYVGSSMGLFWSVINPIILLGLYTFVFGFLIHPEFGKRFVSDSDNAIDIALYIFCGLLPWYAFQESIIRMTTCVVDNGHLVRQIRFPAKILPAYLVLSSLVNQTIGTVILVGAVWWIRQTLSISLWAFPFVLLLQAILAFGLGLFLSTLHVYLRDTAPLVTIAIMIAMWTTPLFYSLEKLPDSLQTLVLCNPLSHLILLYQYVFLAGGDWSPLVEWSAWIPLWIQPWIHWIVVTVTALFAFFVGYRMFTRLHVEFVDVI